MDQNKSREWLPLHTLVDQKIKRDIEVMFDNQLHNLRRGQAIYGLIYEYRQKGFSHFV